MATDNTEVYLGNGLYVSFDGQQFCFRGENHHVLYFDARAMNALDEFRARVSAAKESSQT